MTVIRLFTTIYPESNPKRRAEYQACMCNNVACDPIAQICVFSESGNDLLPPSAKITCRSVSRRPTYNDYFDWITKLAADDDISIIANTDIYFDQQLHLFNHWQPSHDQVLALSRWEFHGGVPKLYHRGDSQDSWFIRGKPRGVLGDFPVGVARCDNRIAAEFERAGYRVENPAYSLRSYHLHDAAPRHYLEPEHNLYIAPPYKYVEPHNLFGIVRTVRHNLTHPECRISYRVSFRRWRHSVPVRAVDRLRCLVETPASNNDAE
jgi:hypothetical protein